MKLARTLISFSLLALVIACGGPGDSATVPEAEPAGATSTDIGDYVVHFSAQSTDQLPPEVARAYNIVRSKNRAMLTVSIIKKEEASPGEAVSGAVSATATNLTGQLKNITLKEAHLSTPRRSVHLLDREELRHISRLHNPTPDALDLFMRQLSVEII